MNEFEKFWGNIWKKTDSIDMEKWSEFRNIMSFHVKVENEGIKEPNLTMKMLKKTLKKDETMEWYRLGPNLYFYVAKDDMYASATVTNNIRSTQK